MAARKLPVGIQSFADIRRNNYIYVDKTQYIWQLIQSGKSYFLSRPRRFGKSLLVSTLEAYYRGHKELFSGLAIEAYENQKGKEAWQVYPVIRISLSGGDYHAPNGLADVLNNAIANAIEQYQLKDSFEVRGETLPVRFSNLITRLYYRTGKNVVVLVDEYDKPLLETMTINKEQEERNRILYKSFFSVLKDEDQYLQFVFFTGVTKFSKVSIFSDLNQLDDISLTTDAAGICGITEDELRRDFQPEIREMSETRHITREECLQSLEKMYDGYHFSADGVGVYNPFSLLSALKKRDFGSYWFETGTPTFLIRKLQESTYTPEQLTTRVEATEMALMDYRAENPDPVPLFYQTGYLTITGFDRRFRIYSLCFPDDEVKYGFLNSLAPYILGNGEAENPSSARNLVIDLEKGNVDSFMNRLQALFAGIPYPEGPHHVYEQEWRNEVFLIFTLLGQHVASEVHSATGRADCVVKTSDYIYIFEFKLDQTADEALSQIIEKGYAMPYQMDPRKIIMIGVNFSTAKRNIQEWKLYR